MWLYDKYKGTLLLAVAQDGNNKTTPIALEIIEGGKSTCIRFVGQYTEIKWTQAYDEGQRWGHMTRNFVESWNSVFKGTCNLPVTPIFQSNYYRLESVFAERAQSVFARAGSGDVFSEYYKKAIKDDIVKSNTHQVELFDRERYTYMYVIPSTTRRKGQSELSTWTYNWGGVIVQNIKLYICLVPKS
ncbi:hypothetical protein MTR_6g086675 [Medicago truncatula]|uniref:Uncharacterized protein n=1 Tax=Medicago truncatula TaxID=3880 RepID=A0A072UBC0_MEDTR|nr:hypothetical protein MTR_6g086675 [Medicago truncatula]